LFNYTPKNKNLNPATQYIPKAYGILNLFAGVRAKNGAWEFSVAGRNILKNKTILTQGLQLQTLTRPPSGNLLAVPTEQLSFAPGSTNLSGYNTISYVARREFQVSARFAFGSR
jgi:iron complex outermembrane receptor protein